MQYLSGILVIAMAILLEGCSPQIIVIDRKGTTFELKKVELERGENIEVIDSEALRYVPLDDIKKLVLDPSQTHYENSKLFYLAVIELNDGTIIQPVKTDNEITNSFVNVDNKLVGKGSSGTIVISFEDINVINQSE